MHQLTRRSLCAIFWRKTKRPLYPSHSTFQIWLQRTFFCFLSWSRPWKDDVSTHLTRSRNIRRRSCSPFRKKRSKVGRKVGSGLLLAKETTLKATNLNKLYLSTYSFYYNSPGFYWSYIVFRGNPFQAHSLEQSYHKTQPFKQEKCNIKSKICVKISQKKKITHATKSKTNRLAPNSLLGSSKNRREEFARIQLRLTLYQIGHGPECSFR